MNSKPQATLIYNPMAGRSQMMGVANLIADAWQAKGWQISIHPTESAGHATTLAQAAAAAGHRLLLAMGGDGTLAEVANGLVGTETVMGVLPSGTANSFAVELGLPLPHRFNGKLLLKANEALINGRVQKMDLGHIQIGDNAGRHWLLWTGVGIDGMVVDWVEPRPKWLRRFGRSGYFAKGILALPQISSFEAEVEIDGRLFQDRYVQILISNCRRYSGTFNLSPHAALDDGLFEVWLLKSRDIPHLAEHLMRMKTSKHVDLGKMVVVNGRSISIRTDPAAICQADGDQQGTTPLHCELKPQALHLLVPDSAPEGLFTQPSRTL